MCTRLQKIEKRLIEIEKLVARDSTERGLSGRGIARHFVENEMEAQNAPLLKERSLLQIERQFILDRRDSLVWRIVWNIIIPVIVSLLTVYLLSQFDFK